MRRSFFVYNKVKLKLVMLNINYLLEYICYNKGRGGA